MPPVHRCPSRIVTFQGVRAQRSVLESMLPTAGRHTGASPRVRRRCLHALLTLALSLAPAATDAQVPDTGRLSKAIARAVALADLPASVRVVAIDPQLAAEPAALASLDAFVVREADGRLRPVVYLNARSDLVREAARGSRLHTHLLAAVVVHEAQHLDGASEVDARRAEAAFIERLVRQQRVSPQVAGRYLEELTKAMRQISEQAQ